MRRSWKLEFVVGVFMIIGCLAIVFLAFRVSGLTQSTDAGAYTIQARFQNIGGLKVRSPVTIAGVLIGRVTDITFDTDTFEAVVTMTISPEYKVLPADSSASILTAGLLGEKYIGIEPGADEIILEEGDTIEFTQPALVLEQLIGKFLTSISNKD